MGKELLHEIVSRVEIPNLGQDQKIIGIDPGGTVGVAFLSEDVVEWGQFAWPSQIRQFDAYLREAKADVLVYETFNLFPQMAAVQIGSSFPAAEVIGVIKYLTLAGRGSWGYLSAVRPIHTNAFTDEVLDYVFNVYGLEKSPVKGRHAKSALRAIIAYLDKSGQLSLT